MKENVIAAIVVAVDAYIQKEIEGEKDECREERNAKESC
jgi:hypothetical protein